MSTALDVFILGSPDLSLRDVAVLLVGITHALPSLALLARRLHDAGFSHAWLFVGLVPLVGPLTLLVFALQPTAPRFGHPTDASDPVPAGPRPRGADPRRHVRPDQ
ncbi:DUF805 domain-containing protein [Micrococcus porci]|uniref:DUF805 domain-containing protein n=1 Tax=Micrococcus porci TaxID=2856555 RepID=UPI001CCF84FE|nr:DUF805 domain-containing protein [Micrococcus porci]UBH25177.1 DUF805 domain-containing protein [Micrococcus porci]